MRKLTRVMEAKGVVSRKDEYLFNANWNREVQYKDYKLSVGSDIF